MKINISEDAGIITVVAEIPSRTLARDPIVECNYHIVKEILLEKGYENLDSVSGRSLVVSNAYNNEVLQGEWQFKKSLPPPPPQAKPAPSPRRKRATKAKKPTPKTST